MSQGDALLVEVQDSKKAVHGEARIPISYLNDNPVCALSAAIFVHRHSSSFPLHHPNLCNNYLELNMQSDRIRWWEINHDDNECVGKIQLSIGSTMTSGDNNHIKVILISKFTLVQ